MLKINSKTIAGLFVAFVLVFGATASVAHAWMASTATKITKSSPSSDVMWLQSTLNAVESANLVADGAYGHKTTTAVKTFQAAHPSAGSVDGIVGPMTLAALNAAGANLTPGQTPTGSLCPNGMTLASNCMSGGTTPTGALCPNGMTIASNCMSNPSGPVNTSGAPFNINTVNQLSGYVSTQVGVGAPAKVIGDIRVVTGAGGSGNLTGVNLSFYNRGTGDYQFVKYAQSVSILVNGVTVGTLPASSFTQYNSQYSAFIPTTGATLNANTTNDIQVAISALPVIDSANLGSTKNTWAYEMGAIRYTDSTGSFSYTIPTSGNFDSGNLTSGTLLASAVFNTASSAQSIVLTVVKDASDYTDHVAVGSASSNTLGVKLTTLDLTATGAGVVINRLPVTITVTNSGSGSTAPSSLINTLRLYAGTDTTVTPLDTESNTATPAGTVTFQNLNIKLAPGVTQVFTITGDLNSIDGTIVIAGATAKVDVTTSNVSSIQAYDLNNNVLSGTSTLTGSTTGSIITFRVSGIQVSAVGTPGAQGGPLATFAAPGGGQTHGTMSFTIPFTVTAFGSGSVYIPNSATAATTASATNTLQFCVDATSACQAIGGATVQYLSADSQVPTANGNYMISSGQSRSFAAVVTYTPTEAHTFRGKLLNVNWSASDVTASGTWNTFTSGLSSTAFMTNNAVGN